jgi:hypothetical protein
MNKFTRFTLFAGLMAFGLVACGDDVQVVQPEPPEPPPLVVSLQPGSAAINVGESIDIAVNVSGGDASVTPTIACSASNGAVTVTTVGSICRVVGVTEGGNATVTAAVTRGTQTLTAGASVTVLEDTEVPATIAIEKVTQGSLFVPVSLNSVTRQIEITVNIDPGTQIPDVVTLLFRGVEIVNQDLNPATVAAMRAADDGSPESQAIRQVTLSWETDAYSVSAVGGQVTGASVATPNHLNGTGQLQARLTVTGGSTTGSAVSSIPVNLTLRNLNGFHLKLARTGSTRTALDVQNFEWRGGIDAAGVTNAGVDAHLVPVLYTPGVTLASAQFTFAGLLRPLTAGPWTFVWTPVALGAGTAAAGAAYALGYTMPLATPAWPNQLRDGEYPAVVGNAVLSDGQGMGPFGGALDCLGAAIGILNIELSAAGLCPLGTAWSPPSATLVAANNQTLDPLRSGERVDNKSVTGQTFTLSSRPGLPDWPQVPTTGVAGDVGFFVNAAGTWVNEGVAFNNAGIHNKAAMIDGVDPLFGTLSGVSRFVAGFPAPTFLASVYMASGGALGAAPGANITATPTGASLPETITPSVYTVTATDADELDNRATLTLAGDGPDADLLADDNALLGSDQTDPFLQHTAAISNPDRVAFDNATVGAGGVAGAELTANAYNYFVNWTDPITVGASGFTAFGGNPVWRHLHLVTPAATAQVALGVGVGPVSLTNVTVAPAWAANAGCVGAGTCLVNYARAGGSQQAVTGPPATATVNGYYIYRAYVLDDAGNASRDALASNPTPVGTLTWESAAIRRQAVVDGPPASGQPVAFGITAPVNMQGGTTVTFLSNSSDNLDLGQSFLSLDYPAFSAGAPSVYWTANSAVGVGPNTVGGYYTPAPTPAGTQGTTGGVRFGQLSPLISSESEHGVIFNSPFESAATVLSATALTRSVPGFIRSIEWVCSGLGVPIATCPAAPADWGVPAGPGIAVNLVNTPAAVGWFAPAGAPVDVAYAAGRPNLASFSQFDATRFDHVPATSGNVNYLLEQTGALHATSPRPNRSVSAAPIPAVSVLLKGTCAANPTDSCPVGVELSEYHDGGLQVGWAISAANISYTGTAITNLPAGRPGAAVGGGRTLTGTATARLVTGSSTVVGGPGQNLFPGPGGRVDFFALEPGTGTLRYLSSQSNPIVFENSPACVSGVNQANYRCWDFMTSFSIANWVGAPGTLQILAVGVDANGDGLATYPADGV